ncbi:serine hydrolase domain-containing protein [Kitasatospora sp. NPDC093558]|uniref:serine hydrolase domain-containing protein n=1 Tax=Kitasatospora sp. NPDC093558 TaxID=3155201 RepID=UPI0034499483
MAADLPRSASSGSPGNPDSPGSSGSSGSPSGPDEPDEPELPADLDHLLRPLFHAAGPGGGVAVAVIRGDERTVVCRGRSDRSGQRPVRADTRFELGSVTKTFTGLLLAEMAARGEVRYDDPIDRYLPADAAPGYPHERPITLLHLATHTSGLPRLPVGLLPAMAPRWFTSPYATFGPAHLLRALPRTPVRGTPGTQVRYSSLGCGLLGLLLANAAGQRYDDLLAVRVCGPLGLVDTSSGPGREEVTGYRRGRRVPSFRLPALPGAAALRSTADDMLRYLQAHLSLDAVPLPERADAAALRTALGEVRRPRAGRRRGGTTRICLGWNQRSVPAGPDPDVDDGEELVFHAGSTRGFTAFASFSPHAQVGLAVMAKARSLRSRGFVQSAYETLRTLAAQRRGPEDLAGLTGLTGLDGPGCSGGRHGLGGPETAEGPTAASVRRARR